MSDKELVITGVSLSDHAADMLLAGRKVSDNGLRLLAEKYKALSKAAEEGESWRVTALAREAELKELRHRLMCMTQAPTDELPAMIVDSICAAPVPPAAPAAVPDDVVRDAARYRWLRDCDFEYHGIASAYDCSVNNRTGDALDEIVDAAMLAAAQKERGE